MFVLLSRTQAGPGRTVKQEQEEISRNHVQTFICLSVPRFPSTHSHTLDSGPVWFLHRPRIECMGMSGWETGYISDHCEQKHELMGTRIHVGDNIW